MRTINALPTATRGWLIATLLSLTGVVGTPALAGDAFAAADALARAAVDKSEIPSVAYAVSRDGRVLHAAAYGNADRERRIPATVRTAYPLASLTKPITATALRVLQRRTGLSLDTPIATLLPEKLRDEHDEARLHGVTLARLLHHTAGLGTYARLYFDGEIACAAAGSCSAQLPYIVTVQTPGRVAEYSNLGYGLLGEAIERRSGKPFAEYVRREVFAPLAMRDAFIAGTDAHRGAIGYDTAIKALPPLWNDTPGAGNAYASVTDLLRFGAFHLNPARVRAMASRLPPPDVAAMRASDDDGARHPMYGDAWYGQGWYVRGSASAPRLVWHEGGMPGASTLLALYPEGDMVVTVLVNRSDAQPFVQALATALAHAAWADAPPLALDPISGFVPLAGPSPFGGDWVGTIGVDGEARPVALRIDAAGNGRLEYAAATGGATTLREFHALTSGPSLVSAVQGPWRSKGAPEGVAALLIKLTLAGDDRIEGQLVAYDGPDRLRFLLPHAVVLRRAGSR